MIFRDLMLILSVSVFTALWMHAWYQEPKKDQEVVKPEPFGFLDLKTGRLVEIDPETGKEYFVD